MSVRNPFDANVDLDRHTIWDRLVRVDSEAFVAGDWSMIESDFDADHFEGLHCDGSANPDDWQLAFPTLESYRDSWLAASKVFVARPFANGVKPIDAMFLRTHLDQIDIAGDRALCRKKFFGEVNLTDGTSLPPPRQTLYRLHRRADSPWGWKIVGFIGSLPLPITLASHSA